MRQSRLAFASLLFASSFSMAAAVTNAPPATAPAAATTAVKKSPAEQIKDIGAALAGKLRIGLSVNTAAKISGIDIKNNGKSVGSAEGEVGNTPALDIQWVNRLYDGPGQTKFDWFVGASFERERSLSSYNIKAKGSATSQTRTMAGDQSPTFHANLLTVGIRWTPTSNLYFPVGLNYGFLTQPEWGVNGKFDVDPAVGFTVGAGYRLTPAFELEAAYKIARYNILLHPADQGPNGTYLDGATELSGLVVSGRYVF